MAPCTPTPSTSAPARRSPILPGDVIGRVELLAKIGRPTGEELNCCAPGMVLMASITWRWPGAACSIRWRSEA